MTVQTFILFPEIKELFNYGIPLAAKDPHQVVNHLGGILPSGFL